MSDSRSRWDDVDPPKALIVDSRSGAELPLRTELERLGWFVTTCGGPASTDCPLMHGEHCLRRGWADIAFVFVNPHAERNGTTLVRIRCAADASSPAVVAVEGRVHPPVFKDRIAAVGAKAGARALVGAAAALLERSGSGRWSGMRPVR